MQPSRGVVRVLVVDEHEVVRRGVIGMLRRDGGVSVVGEAASVGEAVVRGLTARPDVAVVGTRLPDGTGADVCASLRVQAPEVRCLLLGPYGDPEAVAAAVGAGAAGYLVEDVRAPGLVSAVRRVAAGATVIGMPSPRPARGCPHPLELLTRRERAVLQLIGEGLTNRQIAARLGLAEKTVKNYVNHLLPKLGVERRTQAAILVTQWGDRLSGSAREPATS